MPLVINILFHFCSFFVIELAREVRLRCDFDSAEYLSAAALFDGHSNTNPQHTHRF